ncbi:DUF257 family protein [Thermococcus peptonophilus]|uniref:Uncharacterized protein n=1 Tax=Thermococcus peptonophilus TaxID=53952 RepID=A0A142CWX1_9EURY|nr:DUF257 family protein [Thermococcus peptonophilus]AMQ19273.1 hypothetical protein A0127_08910 [Thermococcus peptonophilus]
MLSSGQKNKGYRIVIEDILDTLYLHRVHLKLSGLDVSILDDVPVIKEGGHQNIGKIIKYIKLSKDYVIWSREYNEVFSSVLMGGRLIDIILGLEKLFLLSNFREVVNVVNAILTYTGDERRIALYFLNKDLIEDNKHFVLPLVEEIATTVVRVSKEDEGFVMSVVKSMNRNLEGATFTVKS